MGKVGPSSSLRNHVNGYSGKTLVMGKWGTEHSRKNAPFPSKISLFGWGRFSCCVPVVPKVI